MSVWSSYHLKLIEPYDPPFRFLVNSFGGGTIYTVDLECYRGNGQCDCENFRFNMEPKLARGADKSDSLRCKHIQVCRAFYGMAKTDSDIDLKRKAERRCKDNDG
jgi:hypothetical protein